MGFHGDGNLRVRGQGDLIRLQRRGNQRGCRPFPVVDKQLDALLIHQHPQRQPAVPRFGGNVPRMGDVSVGAAAAFMRIPPICILSPSLRS